MKYLFVDFRLYQQVLGKSAKVGFDQNVTLLSSVIWNNCKKSEILNIWRRK